MANADVVDADAIVARRDCCGPRRGCVVVTRTEPARAKPPKRPYYGDDGVQPYPLDFMNEQQAIDKRLPVSQHPVCEPANFVRPTLFVTH